MKRGDRVTVLLSWEGRRRVLRAAYVTTFVADVFDVRLHGRLFGGDMYEADGTFVRAQEGITWCRGHSGPAVDALRAAQALV